MKMQNEAKLTDLRKDRRRIEELLLGFRMAKKETVKVRSWVRTIRESLGLREAELAEVMGYAQGSIYRMEQSEMESSLQMKYLRRAAEAMKCELVYAIVPKEGTLEELALDFEEARYEISGDDEMAKLRREIWKVLKAGTRD
jgi:predicted DNA-binding mobile mystery protein A